MLLRLTTVLVAISAWLMLLPATTGAAVSIDSSGCGTTTLDFGTVTLGSSNVTSSDCVILISGDQAGGAMLRVAQADSAGRLESTNAIPDYASGTDDWDQGTDGMLGVCLRAVTGTLSPAWTTAPGGNCNANDGVPWNAVPASPGPTGKIAGVGVPTADGTVYLRFGLRIPNVMPPGAYAGAMLFEVLEPNV